MPPSLVLVRHAMPAVDPATPSVRWQLSEDGKAAARALRPRIPAAAYFVSSPEPKALQTVQQLGEEITTDAGFGEARRLHVWGDDYGAQARAYVDGRRHPGWEPHDEVARRFDDAMRRHLTDAGGRTLVVGTHGLAPTVWLASRVRLADPGEFWAALGFPDLIDVDLEQGTAGKRQPPSGAGRRQPMNGSLPDR
jgi:broad specificity phosphatase PhoE